MSRHILSTVLNQKSDQRLNRIPGVSAVDLSVAELSAPPPRALRLCGEGERPATRTQRLMDAVYQLLNAVPLESFTGETTRTQRERRG